MTNHRTEKTRVKTARGRKISSTLWLNRQLNDPYVQQAKKDGYRSRAAYKLIELDDKYQLLSPNMKVLDLGAAPGGWLQVAAARTKSSPKHPHVFGIDLLDITPIAGAEAIQLDFMDDAAPAKLQAMAGGKVDIVLSDMAPNTTGHTATDHLRIVALVEAAFYFACDVLEKDGSFVAKVWQGGTEGDLLAEMKRKFEKIAHAKPKSSRQGSAEMFVVAKGFRG
jgi:23S rRNA (uridine2552-2'-O)-methyltransferase